MDDAFAIQQLLNRYSIHASRKDWDAVLDTYAAEGIWSLPDFAQQFVGHEAIRGALINFAAPMDYVVQLNTPAAIALDGDTATATCVIREFGRLTDGAEAMEVLGLYDDRLVRTAGGWRFAERSFTIRGMHTVALTTVQY